MIERKFITEKIKEFQIQEIITNSTKNAEISQVKLKKTPLGEKIIISTSKPGLVVGKKGENIQKLTRSLKKKFKLENPQLEVSEIEFPNLNSKIVAEKIVKSLEMFGTNRFKGIGHKVMSDVLNSGAVGVEIIISGKIPGSRAKSWRFYSGYIKKCGDYALTGVDTAYGTAKLKTGVVGVKVKIMLGNTKLPDKITFIEGDTEKEGNTKEDKKEKKKKKMNKKKKAEEKEKPEKLEETEDEDKRNKNDE